MEKLLHLNNDIIRHIICKIYNYNNKGKQSLAERHYHEQVTVGN